MAMVMKALGLLSDRLHLGASVRNVFGDSVEAHGRTVIPVARIGYGFGAGGRAGGNAAAGPRLPAVAAAPACVHARSGPWKLPRPEPVSFRSSTRPGSAYCCWPGS